MSGAVKLYDTELDNVNSMLSDVVNMYSECASWNIENSINFIESSEDFQKKASKQMIDNITSFKTKIEKSVKNNIDNTKGDKRYRIPIELKLYTVGGVRPVGIMSTHIKSMYDKIIKSSPNTILPIEFRLSIGSKADASDKDVMDIYHKAVSASLRGPLATKQITMDSNSYSKTIKKSNEYSFYVTVKMISDGIDIKNKTMEVTESYDVFDINPISNDEYIDYLKNIKQVHETAMHNINVLNNTITTEGGDSDMENTDINYRLSLLEESINLITEYMIESKGNANQINKLYKDIDLAKNPYSTLGKGPDSACYRSMLIILSAMMADLSKAIYTGNKSAASDAGKTIESFYKTNVYPFIKLDKGRASTKIDLTKNMYMSDHINVIKSMKEPDLGKFISDGNICKLVIYASDFHFKLKSSKKSNKLIDALNSKYGKDSSKSDSVKAINDIIKCKKEKVKDYYEFEKKVSEKLEAINKVSIDIWKESVDLFSTEFDSVIETPDDMNDIWNESCEDIFSELD